MSDVFMSGTFLWGCSDLNLEKGEGVDNTFSSVFCRGGDCEAILP